MNRKIFFVIALISILFFLACFNRHTEEHSEEQYNSEEDFEIEIRKDDDGIEYVVITKYVGIKKDVIIPPYIQDLPVVVIGLGAFSNNQLTSIIIPNSVEDIYPYAFMNNQLKAVTISDKITTIPTLAFSKNQLTSVIIPDNVTVIDTSAFKENQLTSLVIPDNVRIIWQDAFAHNKLTSVTLSKGLTLIRSGVFYDNQLTSLTIPEGMLHITERAFAQNKLTSVIIPDSLISIQRTAFSANQISNITISARVKLETSAFDNNGFRDFYNDSERKAGVYTLNNGKWSSKYFVETHIEPQIDGIYEIVSAYSIITNRRGMNEIETENLGTRIIIDRNTATIENEIYLLNDAEYDWAGKYSITNYDKFLTIYTGANETGFDRGIIGNNYNGDIKIKITKNNGNEYRLFFTDNKLIIETTGKETEFDHLTRRPFFPDYFFYITEKIVE